MKDIIEKNYTRWFANIRIIHTAVADGVHVRLKCDLSENKPVVGSRKQIFEQLKANVERSLDVIYHPGYYRAEERVNPDGSYSLLLVPIYKSTMLDYIGEFADRTTGLNDLECSLWRIDNVQMLEEALKYFNEIFTEMAETAEKSDGAVATAE